MEAGGRRKAGFRFEVQPTEHLAAGIILHCPVSRDGQVVVKLADWVDSSQYSIVVICPSQADTLLYMIVITYI